MTSVQTPCLTKEQLRKVAAGDLEDVDLVIACEHLDNCRQCRGQIESLDLTADPLLSTLRRDADSGQFGDEDGCRRAMRWLTEESSAKPSTSADTLVRQVGRYRLTSLLARGGMSDVYTALHPDLQTPVAVKVLKVRSSNTEEKQRFRREMSAIGTLDHPHVVRAMDAGVDQQHQYLVMQLVDGIDVGHLCLQHGQLSVADACEVVRQAALGLQHAHENGLVHRDVKPSNLMLRRDGTVLLLDLGLARWEDAAAESLETSDGQILGTVDYLAPEQGINHKVDFRADLYSLGATLYKLLTGATPYDGVGGDSLLAKLTSIASRDPIPIDQRVGDLPVPLCELVQACLSRSPSARPTSAKNVANQLLSLGSGSNLAELGQSACETRPQPVPIDPSRQSSRKRSRFIAVVIAAACCGIAIFFLLPSHPASPPPSKMAPLVESSEQPGLKIAPVTIIDVPSQILDGHSDCIFRARVS